MNRQHAAHKVLPLLLLMTSLLFALPAVRSNAATVTAKQNKWVNVPGNSETFIKIKVAKNSQVTIKSVADAPNLDYIYFHLFDAKKKQISNDYISLDANQAQEGTGKSFYLKKGTYYLKAGSFDVLDEELGYYVERESAEQGYRFSYNCKAFKGIKNTVKSKASPAQFDPTEEFYVNTISVPVFQNNKYITVYYKIKATRAEKMGVEFEDGYCEMVTYDKRPKVLASSFVLTEASGKTVKLKSGGKGRWITESPLKKNGTYYAKCTMKIGHKKVSDKLGFLMQIRLIDWLEYENG